MHPADDTASLHPRNVEYALCYNLAIMNEETVDINLDEQGSTPHLEEEPRSAALLIGGIVLLLILIAGVVIASIAMIRHPNQTETIRDIVIIFMAAESLILGLVLIVLILQIARLTTMLQNEIKPILESTQETLGTLRGTSAFLSKNLVNPVVKVSGSISALRRALDFVTPRRSRKR